MRHRRLDMRPTGFANLLTLPLNPWHPHVRDEPSMTH